MKRAFYAWISLLNVNPIPTLFAICMKSGSVAFVSPCLDKAKTINPCLSHAGEALDLLPKNHGNGAEVIAAATRFPTLVCDHEQARRLTLRRACPLTSGQIQIGFVQARLPA